MQTDLEAGDFVLTCEACNCRRGVFRESGLILCDECAENDQLGEAVPCNSV